MAKPKNRVNVVYSTNPDFQYETEQTAEPETLPAEQQKLFVELDKKARAGKQVTLVTGFQMTSHDLEVIVRQLKNLCGSGGSSDGDQILVQGDHREKIINWLQARKYQVKRKGG